SACWAAAGAANARKAAAATTRRMAVSGQAASAMSSLQTSRAAATVFESRALHVFAMAGPSAVVLDLGRPFLYKAGHSDTSRRRLHRGSMAGHSQFKNIMHRKGRQDAVRSKMFSKLAREITVAAKTG